MDSFRFAPPNGAFRVIGGYLESEIVMVDVEAPTPTTVLSEGEVTVRGIGVPHFNAPTVGYRVDVGDASIGFASDQIGTNPAFTDLIRDVDVWVVHFAASEEPELIAGWHARPSVWGQMARDARAGRIVLSHLSEPGPSHPRYSMHSVSDFEGSVAHVRSHYDGPITVAEDLLCVAVE